MPRTLPHRLVGGRAAQTGERHQHALDELRGLDPGTPPVPDAATLDQAFLEAQLLERLGRWNPDRWRPRMQPFGVRSVSPRPHEIVVRVPAEFLPDVLHAVLPCWDAAHDDREYQDVYGIPGLRARHEQGRGILHRPGFPGRISVPAAPGLWRKALLVAAGLSGGPGQARMPWLTVPGDWDPGEARFTAAWPDSYSPAGSGYHESGFASRIMRRLPGLCPRPRARWHDLWVNHHGSGPEIQFEWENGPAHAPVLERLLDPEFGPGAQLELREGQTEQGCRAGTAGHVRLRPAGGDPGCIVLRRLLSPGSEVTPAGWSLGAARRAERDAIERLHGYEGTRAPGRTGAPAPAKAPAACPAGRPG
jgi:hypothetical protein